MFAVAEQVDFVSRDPCARGRVVRVPSGHLAYDLAFDDQKNLGSLPNYATPFSAPGALPMNGKSLVKPIPGTPNVLPVSTPRYLFLAVPSSSEGPGVVDVVDLETLERVDTDVFQPGVQSIAARGAQRVAHYFRQ